MSPWRSIWSSRRNTPKFSCIVSASSSRIDQRPLAFRAIEQRLQLPLGVGLGDLGDVDRRVRERPVGRVLARRACRT